MQKDDLPVTSNRRHLQTTTQQHVRTRGAQPHRQQALRLCHQPHGAETHLYRKVIIYTNQLRQSVARSTQATHGFINKRTGRPSK